MIFKMQVTYYSVHRSVFAKSSKAFILQKYFDIYDLPLTMAS